MPRKYSQPAQEVVTYNITIEPQRYFNPSTGLWEIKKPYTTPEWVRYGEEVSIQNGKASTQNPIIALELLDSGAIVEPDPRPLLQEQHAAALQIEGQTNPLKLQELARYVNETNVWRKEHGFDPLSIQAPSVPTPVSALLIPVAQAG